MEIGPGHILLVKQLAPTLRKVLSRIPSGMDNDRIAKEVGLTTSTLSAYMVKIYSGLQIPDSIPSRKERRRIAGMIWDEFAKLYTVDDFGHIVAEGASWRSSSIGPSAQESSPVLAIADTPAPADPVHTNGVPHPVAKEMRPEDSPDAVPKVTTQGYGVGITVVVPEPETVTDMRTLVLGSDSSGDELQKLIREGYLPEIVNDYQSLSGTRSITKLILVKRKP